LTGVPYGDSFREARKQKKLTQTAAARALGISQSAIAQWEAGRSLPGAELAAKIEKLFHVKLPPGEQAKTQAGRHHAARARLPLIGLPAPGDDEVVLIDGFSHGDVVAPPQLESVDGARAVYVRGRAMEPRYYPGEVIYLHPNRPPNPGDYVFVTARAGGFATPVGYIRQYLGQDLMHVRLLMLSPKAEQLIAKEDVMGIAVIVGSGLL
jgi:transcriptional regulator with XRE-family HTH domain